MMAVNQNKIKTKSKQNLLLNYKTFHCALALDAWRTNKVNSSPRRSLRVAELVVVVRILSLLRWFSSF